MTEPSTSTSTDAPALQNLWLVFMAFIGVVLLFVGVLMAAAGGDSGYRAEPGMSGTQIAGGWLIGAGATLLALWMASAAICWQLRQSSS